jgi:hypothetical protein
LPYRSGAVGRREKGHDSGIGAELTSSEIRLVSSVVGRSFSDPIGFVIANAAQQSRRQRTAVVGDCRVALRAPRNDRLLFNPRDFGTRALEDNPPARSKLDIAAGIPIALDPKVADLRTAEQMRLEVRLVRDEGAIILDRKLGLFFKHRGTEEYVLLELMTLAAIPHRPYVTTCSHYGNR